MVYFGYIEGSQIKKERKVQVMRLKNFTSIEQFLAPLDRCRGKILLISREGDTYNLNSKLTQLYTVSTLLDKLEREYDLICSEKEDELYLRNRLFN